MTGTELHQAINLARLIGNADGIRRVFRRCSEFTGLLHRLSQLGPQLLASEGRIEKLVRYRRGMTSKEVGIGYLSALLEFDRLTLLSRSALRGLVGVSVRRGIRPIRFPQTEGSK